MGDETRVIEDADYEHATSEKFSLDNKKKRKATGIDTAGAAASFVAAFDEPTETLDAVIMAILVTLGGPTARHAPI